MDRRPTTLVLWRYKAWGVFRRLVNAKNRFSASLHVNRVTTLAAADELAAATRDATAWTAANPSPDGELGRAVAMMLNTCAEAALTAQQAITEPSSDIEAQIDRLADLLAIIDLRSQMMDAW